MITSGSASGGLLEIGISLVMQDRFSHPAREANNELRRLHQEAKTAIQANLSRAQNIGNTMSNLGSIGIRAMGNIINAGSEYIDLMTSVRAITQATSSEYAKLGDRAKQLGLDTVFSAKNIAGGMKYLAMAGMNSREILDVIGGATYLAGATGINLEGKGGAADLMTNVAKMYDIASAGGTMKVADILAKGTLSANISVQDLAESIKYAGSTMVTFNRPLEEGVALIGALGNAGIQGSMAGVALQNMFQFLSKAITDTESKGAKALANLGINPLELQDSNGELKDTLSILTRIKQALPNKTQIEQVGILRDLFSMRGQRGAVALIRNIEDFRDLYTDIRLNSKNYAQQINDERMNSLWGKLEQFQEAITTFKIAYSEAVEPFIKKVFSVGTSLINWAVKGLDTWWGRALAIGAMVVPFVLKIGGKIIGVFAWIRQAQTDTLVNGGNMFKALFRGWTATNNQAFQYLTLLRQIQLLQAGIGTGMGNISSMSKKKKALIAGQAMAQTYYSGKYIGKINSKGNWVFWEKSSRKGMPPKSLGKLSNNPTLAKELQKKMLFPTIAGAGARGALGKGVLARLGGAALGLGRFLMGPWGIALTAISMLLPPLIGAIKNRVAQTKESQEATEKNTHSIYTLAGKLPEDQRKAENKNLGLTEELILLSNTIRAFNRRLEEANKEDKPISTRDIVINIDGKEAIRTAIEDDKTETNLQLGIA